VEGLTWPMVGKGLKRLLAAGGHTGASSLLLTYFSK
jgi:hypothetical protein